MKRVMMKSQQGIGLLELMLSLAIIAVLLVIATRYYETAKTGEQVNEAIGIVQAIRGASAQWAAGKPSYSGLNMSALYNYGLLPRSVGGGNNDGVGTNPWGGNVSVTPINSNAQVQVTLTKVPTQACNNLIGKLSYETPITPTCNGGNFVVTFGAQYSS